MSGYNIHIKMGCLSHDTLLLLHSKNMHEQLLTHGWWAVTQQAADHNPESWNLCFTLDQHKCIMQSSALWHKFYIAFFLPSTESMFWWVKWSRSSSVQPSITFRQRWRRSENSDIKNWSSCHCWQEKHRKAPHYPEIYSVWIIECSNIMLGNSVCFSQ